MLKGLLEATSSLVFPTDCEICSALLPASHAFGVCEKCTSSVHLIPPPHCVSCGRTLKMVSGIKCAECQGETFNFDRAYACTFYDSSMKELLHAYKFNNRTILKSFFTDLMIEFIELNLDPEHFDMFAAVPLDPERKNSRGFNQSEILCSKIAKKFGKIDVSSKLGRKRSPYTQSLLKRSDRSQNVKDRFFLKEAGIISGMNILLIDDILTTGQTASECARTLKAAGASSVTVLALARGI